MKKIDLSLFLIRITRILVLLLIASGAVNAQKYIKQTASGSGDGSSWDNALGGSSLRTTLAAGGTVYIAAGTYNINAAFVSDAVILPAGTTVIGGFPSTATGVSISGYNPAANVTLIDGQDKMILRLGNGTYVVKGIVFDNAEGAGGGGPVINAQASGSYSWTIEDCIIKNTTGSGGGGGAVWLHGAFGTSTTLKVKNCIFENNQAIAGSYTGALMIDQVANTSGGAATSTNNGTDYVVEGCSFNNNRVTAGGSGGAMQILSSTGINLINNNFCNNFANNDAGALLVSSVTKFVMSGCNFTGNSNQGQWSPAVWILSSPESQVLNCTFVGNFAASGALSNNAGGGLAIESGTPHLVDGCKFYDNIVRQRGGGFAFSGGGSLTLQNCTFKGNQVTTGINAFGGGAIYATSGSTATISLSNNIFDSNSLTDNTGSARSGYGGGAVHVQGGNSPNASNSVFYNNSYNGTTTSLKDDVSVFGGGTFTVANSTLQLPQAAYTSEYNVATGNTFSNTTNPGVASAPVVQCAAGLLVTLGVQTPAAQTATVNEAKTGNAATELAPSGGTGPYVYSDGTNDPGCVAPGGASVLPSGSNLVVQSTTGAYSYTAPSTPGTYYFCIKVCDSATPTPDCVYATYTVVVSPVCNAGVAAPALSATTLTNVCPLNTISLSGITASNTPSGAVLTWHSGTPATNANKITGAAVGAGTYYAAFFDSANNCYSGTTAGSATTAVTASLIPCGTCSAGSIIAYVHGDDLGYGNARVWLSKGDGTFETGNFITTALNFTRYNQGTRVYGRDNNAATMWEDVDRDGDLDIVHATENNNNTIYVYFNNGNNTFEINPTVTTSMQADGSGEIFAGVTAAEQSWLRDTNGDGILDYVFSNNSDKITVWFGNANGTFSTTISSQTTLSGAGSYHTSGISNAELFLLDDVTGDGVADLIGTYDDSGSGRIIVWTGIGNGAFNAAPHYTRLLEDTGFTNSSGAADNEYSQFADINGDGFLDYCHAENADSTPDIWVWLNNGSGQFPTTPVRTQVPNVAANLPAGGLGAFANYTAGAQSFFVDVNNDGLPDFVNASDDVGSNSGFTVYVNSGSGAFSTTPIRTIIPNDFRTGSDNGSETAFLGCGFAFKSINPTPVIAGAGSIDCAKTQITPMPVQGTPAQVTLRVTVNVTTVGSFPINISGSGMTLVNGITSVTATITGNQDFYIPLKYDGSALGTLNFSVGASGSCAADLSSANAKRKAIVDIWTLDCVPVLGPSIK